jgi:hypothetical protein
VGRIRNTPSSAEMPEDIAHLEPCLPSVDSTVLLGGDGVKPPSSTGYSFASWP